MVLVIIALILLIPAFILFGMLGVSIYALWKLFLFLLKYCLPAVILGFGVAKIRSKRYTLYAEDYWIHAGVAAGVALVVIFLWMFIPAKIRIPAADQVTSLTSVREYNGKRKEQDAWEQYQIDDFIETMENLQLRHTLTEFIRIDEDESIPYQALVVCEDGTEYVYTFHSDRIMSIGDGSTTRYYRTKKGTQPVPKDSMSNMFTAYQRMEAQKELKKVWEPFVEEFFETIHYDPEDGMVYFRIPDTIPEGNYSITTDITTVEFLEGGKEKKQKLTPFQEQQSNDTWEPGQWYSFPLPEAKYITFDFEVDATNGLVYTFDLMSQIPMEYHRYPW